MSAEDQLVDYREQTPEVKRYFEDLRSREVVLKVEELGKVFGEGPGATEALQDVSFNVHHREFVSIVGSNRTQLILLPVTSAIIATRLPASAPEVSFIFAPFKPRSKSTHGSLSHDPYHARENACLLFICSNLLIIQFQTTLGQRSGRGLLTASWRDLGQLNPQHNKFRLEIDTRQTYQL